MKSMCCAFVMMACAAAGMAQDMRNNVDRSLFADQKATRIGDAVMVLVVETTSATNDASTTAERSSSLSVSASGSAGSDAMPTVNGGVGTGNAFKGEGATSARGSVRARISARVDSVLANGNLVITGSRTIVINGEEQYITISGIVRPSDVQADNSVYSYNISEARIAFEGSGIVARAQGPGWITKLLHWLF